MKERYIPCPTNSEGCKHVKKLIPCPKDNKDCRYYPDCHDSIHHIYPRRTAETRLQRNFGDLAINKIISCRLIHDLLDTFPPPQYPEPDEMRRIIERENG